MESALEMKLIETLLGSMTLRTKNTPSSKSPGATSPTDQAGTYVSELGCR